MIGVGIKPCFIDIFCYNLAMNTNHFKSKLEAELKLIESELKEVARKNPTNSNDWEPVETDLNADTADIDEVADEVENFNTNESILSKLEPKYNDIKLALEKIEAGTYGTCEVSGEPIPEERLEANPSARTCIEHAK